MKTKSERDGETETGVQQRWRGRLGTDRLQECRQKSCPAKREEEKKHEWLGNWTLSRAP